MDFLGKLIEMLRKLIGNPKLNISCLFSSILFYYYFSKTFFLLIILCSVVLIVEFGFFLKEKHNANKISDFYDAFNAQGKYIAILKEIEKKLYLKNWINISDSAIRSIIHEDFFNSDLHIYLRKVYISKNKQYKKINKLLENLAKDFEDYITEFERHCCKNGVFFVEDKSYKKTYNKNHDDIAKEHDIWYELCFGKLYNLTYSLNELREESIKLFSIDKLPESFRKKFTLTDGMGHTNKTKPCEYLPNKRIKKLKIYGKKYYL